MKRNRIFTAALLSSVLLLTACGGSSEETSGETTASAAEETTETAEAAASEVSTEEPEEAATEDAGEEETAAAAEETTESAAEAETEETASTESTEETQASLSDDLYSFEVSIDGDIYQLPMSYQDFTALGWVYDGDDSEKLESRASYSTLVFDRGDDRIYADLTNFDVNSAPITDSYVTKLDFDETMMDPAGVDIALPGGIIYGKSTLDEAKAAYGTATREYEGSMNTTETYTKDSYQEVELQFSAEDNILNGISIENISEPQDMEYGEVSSEVPAVTEAYQTPEEMSDDPADFIVDFAGDLYQLPAPVSVFTANGWEIQEDDSQMNVEGTGYGWVTLMKDNQQLRAMAVNYSDDATAIENCFLTSVKSAEYDCNVDLTIFGGITRDMTEEDLKTAIGDTTTEVSEESSYTCYQVEPVSDKLNCYTIYIDNETGKVRSIEVENQPKQADFRKQLGTE